MDAPVTRQELADLRQLLASPLAPGLSPAKTLLVVDSALHYEELAAKHLAAQKKNRAAQARHRKRAAALRPKPISSEP